MSHPSPPPSTPTANHALLALDLLDSMRTLIETVQGYRISCEEAGFMPEIAQAMALQLHAALMTNAQAPQAPQPT